MKKKKTDAKLVLTSEQLAKLREHDWFPKMEGAFITLCVEDFVCHSKFAQACEAFLREDYIDETTKLHLCVVGFNSES